jgi:hypothetical protein
MTGPVHLLFVKLPAPGRAKTRLGRAVGVDAAADLSRAFTEAALERYRAADRSPVICFTPENSEGAVRDWLGHGLEYRPQHGADLGERMENAFREAFERGAHAAILAGTDVPDLEPERLLEAERALRGNDAVLGPAEDGGYHLIGLTRRGFSPDLFRDVPWSTPRVLPRTLARLTARGMAVHQLPTCADVDELADLRALARRLDPRGPHARLARLVAATLESAGEQP